MTKVILKGYIVVPDSDLAAVATELPRHIELTRQEPGCLVFEVVQDGLNKNTFTVYEEFTGNDSFAFHQERIKGSSWALATVRVERHYQLDEGL